MTMIYRDLLVCLTRIVQPVIRTLLLVSGVLLAGCHDAENPSATPVPRVVKTVIAEPLDGGELVTLTGEIRPHMETALGFRLDGRILTRLVDVGAVVKAGDLMATLDPRDSENQLQSAQASLQSAISAERLAGINLNRMKKLVSSGAIARVQLDEAQSTWETAVARRESAQSTLKGAKERCSFTQLVAPQAGVVTSVSGNPGQVVSAGQEVIKLAALSGRDAVFDVSEQLINSGLTNPVVTVSLISDPSVKGTGHVRDVSPQADPVTRTYRVRIALDNPPAALVFGATVLGSVQLPGTASFPLPASALSRQGDQPAVYVVNPATQLLRLQPISVARYSKTQIFVSTGLMVGDRVVTAGVSKLRPDEKVLLDEESH
ncbi:efflux RND transporter periplasmic adaptor subunit [Pectobacteriaceae bacterium CE70]|nr:efflux RND transporter periplasmic adaptor subunit [Pectobacteriaceae bacterium CE70]WJY12201.1 efflux RND transporter periplasmic adaptor subunit [Pectobacteriaceae bacterium C80]